MGNWAPEEQSPQVGDDGKSVAQPYLSGRNIRDLFFPWADDSSFSEDAPEEHSLEDQGSIAGDDSTAGNMDEDEEMADPSGNEISPEKEQELLRGPPNIFSPPSLVNVTPSVLPPVTNPPGLSQDPAMAALLNQITLMNQRMNEQMQFHQQHQQQQLEERARERELFTARLDAMNARLNQKSDQDQTMADIAGDLPTDDSSNRWRSCLGTSIVEGKLLVGEAVWDLSKVEFFPGIGSFPLAYWRTVKGLSLLTNVPEETILVPAGKANNFMREFALAHNCTPLEGSLMKKGQPGFRVSDSVDAPFSLKAFRTVQDAIEKNKLSGKPLKRDRKSVV